jgi:demethylspheroidene O-methyltransferase
VTAREQVSGALGTGDGRTEGLGGRWLALRNRLLGSPRFQRWAARFPLTRPIARRRASELFDLTAGFVYSQVLFACVELDVFELLRAGPRSVGEIAEATGLPPGGAARLLAAAESLRLLQRRGEGRFALGMLGAAMLGNPGIGAMIAHHARLYADLSDPVALLRGRRDTALADYWPYAAAAQPGDLTPDQVDAYSSLMADSQGFIADDVLDAYPLDGHRRLLDLGGGEGVFAARAAARWPQLRASVFDLPAVAARAGNRFARLGLDDRVGAVGGDLFRDEPPRDADLVSLVRVLHDHGDRPARQILAAAHKALLPGGRLLVAEPMAGTPGAERVGEAYFGFYLMAMGSGRPRSAKELTVFIRDAGFSGVREVRAARPMLVRVLIAEKSHGTVK